MQLRSVIELLMQRMFRFKRRRQKEDQVFFKKRKKSARLIYLISMENLAPLSTKIPKITKRKKVFDRPTPKKRAAAPMDELMTVKKQDTMQLNLFQNSNTYKLDFLNSITISEGKIFNLLSLHSEKPRTQRKVKCKCTKSRCQSKYCQCFAKGRICGVQCQCQNCQNTRPIEHSEKTHVEKGCKCSKSECQKNYCQCYQKGQPCSEKCCCINCKNDKS